MDSRRVEASNEMFGLRDDRGKSTTQVRGITASCNEAQYILI